MPRSLRRAVGTVLLTAITSIAVMASADASSPRLRAPRRAPAIPVLRARITFTGASRSIPASFLGLSVEFDAIARYERAGRPVDRVFALLRSPGDRSLLVRVGGRSADRAWWYTAGIPAPAGVFTIGRRWLSGLATFVARDHLKMLLGLNLAVHSPPLEVAFASAALRALPRSTLAGLEIGNEPDLYRQQPSLDRQRIPTTERGLARRWAPTYSPLEYQEDYVSYARALRAKLDSVPLVAPDTTTPALRWLTPVTGLGPLAPQWVSVHRYAYSTCWPKSSPQHPTIPRLLSEQATVGLAQSVRAAVTLAHRHDMQFRITELNSISCGGNAGVADSFATALWAPDALFELISAGVDGVNVHLRPASVNAPFQLTRHGIRVLPELYGLTLFAQLVGSHARLLATTVRGPHGLHLNAWATRRGSVTSVLLINDGARNADVSVPAPGRGAPPAALRRLLAPSISSVSGISYAGRSLGRDGRWHGRAIVGTASPGRRAEYHVRVPAFSAVTVIVGPSRA
ncbi:MAG: glycosyl hydrolase family 79 C-terminal domain-containing protein [Solirubrobacteraceae bacterium]